MIARRIDRLARELESRARRITIPQRVEEAFGPYRDDPVKFCREVLGAESAQRRSNGELYQFEVLRDLVAHPRVAVRSGHGVGKTALCAWALLWWLLTRPMSRVVVLAPEFSRQVRGVIFAEVRRWVRRAKVRLPVTCLAHRVIVEGYGEEWAAIGMSASGDPDRIEGFHSEAGVLVIADETKGIPQDAFDSVMGALTSAESRLLVASVPGGAGAGPFWKLHQQPDRWRIHHIPATDSSLVAPEWCEDRARDWGVESPLYQTRVLGQFADAGEGVLFPLALVEAAMTVPVGPPPPGVAASLGVDVARSIAGDFNAVALCEGNSARIVELWQSPDLMETVQRVLRIVAKTGVRRVVVDVGGVGAGVADRLRELGHDVTPVHFGGAATEPERFRNLRAELLWKLREALERGLTLPDDDELRADLAALRYEFTQDGRIQIESKDEVRRRLGRSPDRCDSLALALAGSIGGFSKPPFIFLGGGEPEETARRELAWFPG